MDPLLKGPVNDGGSRDELVLQPARGSRWGWAVILSGAVAALGACVAFLEPHVPNRWPLAALLLVCAVVLAVRCLRQEIRCAQGVVTTRGIVVTRHIDAGAITEVTNSGEWYPQIHWRTATGRQRRTVLPAFWTGREALPSPIPTTPSGRSSLLNILLGNPQRHGARGVHEHNLRQLERLNDWIDRQP